MMRRHKCIITLLTILCIAACAICLCACKGCNHDGIAKVSAMAATCTENGNVEHWHCSRCLKNFEEAEAEHEIVDVAVTATGHQNTKVSSKDATCTDDGNVEYWHCSKCLNNFEDANGETKIDDVTVPAAHNMGNYAYIYEDKVYRRDCNACNYSEDVVAGSAAYPYLARDEEELHEVVDEAEANSVIKLANDIDVTYVDFSNVYTLPEGGTLDLGGHIVNVTRAPGCFVVEGTNVTIQNGTVNLSNGNKGDYALFVGDEGDNNAVTVKNINSNAGINVYNCVATVINCNLDASSRTYYALWADEHSTIIVESGTYIGGATACVRSTADGDDEEGNGNIRLNGGTFTGDIIATDKTEIYGGIINGVVKLSNCNNRPAYLLVSKDYTMTLSIVCRDAGHKVTQTTDEDGNKIYQQELSEE